jgi:hypothetical protein
VRRTAEKPWKDMALSKGQCRNSIILLVCISPSSPATHWDIWSSVTVCRQVCSNFVEVRMLGRPAPAIYLVQPQHALVRCCPKMVQEKEGWQGDNTGASCLLRQKATKLMCGGKGRTEERGWWGWNEKWLTGGRLGPVRCMLTSEA